MTTPRTGLAANLREPRAYHVEPTTCFDGFQRGMRHRQYAMFWLHTSGDGHWCSGRREAGKFPTQDEAVQAGELWLETGLSPADQTEERIKARRAAVEGDEPSFLEARAA